MSPYLSGQNLIQSHSGDLVFRLFQFSLSDSAELVTDSYELIYSVGHPPRSRRSLQAVPAGGAGGSPAGDGTRGRGGRSLHQGHDSQVCLTSVHVFITLLVQSTPKVNDDWTKFQE